MKKRKEKMKNNTLTCMSYLTSIRMENCELKSIFFSSLLFSVLFCLCEQSDHPGLVGYHDNSDTSGGVAQ
jgi:hypothetical protein